MDETQPVAHIGQRKNNKKVWIVAAVVVVIVVLVAGFFFAKALFIDNSGSPQIARTLLLEESSSVDFPLYYPELLPEGVSVDEESVSTQEQAVFLSYTYNDTKQLIVTQQAKPPIMEDVKKTKTFDTPAGKAYIADLNGKVTGFIATDETLIIISNADKNDSNLLAQFMGSFEPIR